MHGTDKVRGQAFAHRGLMPRHLLCHGHEHMRCHNPVCRIRVGHPCPCRAVRRELAPLTLLIVARCPRLREGSDAVLRAGARPAWPHGRPADPTEAAAARNAQGGKGEAGSGGSNAGPVPLAPSLGASNMGSRARRSTAWKHRCTSDPGPEAPASAAARGRQRRRRGACSIAAAGAPATTTGEPEQGGRHRRRRRGHRPPGSTCGDGMPWGAALLPMHTQARTRAHASELRWRDAC